MAVEKISAGESKLASQQVAQKRQAVEDEKIGLEIEQARAARDRARAGQQAKEKTDRELVAISKAGEKQVEMTRKLASERVRLAEDNSQKHFADLAQKTAEEIKRIDAEALKTIETHKAGAMERVLNVTSKSEDPFYSLKTLSPTMSEGDRAFTVKVALPEHEAKNLFVTGEGQSLKLALARRYQDQVKNPEQALTTKTNSYQTVVESLAMPSPINAKGIRREYAEGVLTITVPKAGLTTIELPEPPKV